MLTSDNNSGETPEQTTQQRIVSFFKNLWKETVHTSWALFKITIPVIILTKIFEEFGLITYLSILLEPVMNLVGLPGALGLVWATGMTTSLYGGIAVFASLATGLDLTVAQVTVLGSMLLIAHSLPVELSVSKKAGAPLLPIAIIRIGGALLYGFLLNKICTHFSIWQGKAEIVFKSTEQTATLFEWALGQLTNLGFIFLVIFAILIIMQLFRAIGLLSLLERVLSPALPIFGMSKRAAPLTIVGMVLGIGYGGALIIRETSVGNIDKREIFNSMALLGLCHSLLEDTLLMVAIGGKLGGLLWGRIVFALLVTFLLARFLGWLKVRNQLKI